MADDEPRDYPLRAPRSSGQEHPRQDPPRTGALARVTGLVAVWWLFAIAALIVVALVWVFA